MNEQKIVKALNDICYYNGHSDELKLIIRHIKSIHDNSIIPMPDEIRNNDCDTYVNVIWQILVIMFGDYGTSPRYGWIDFDNKDDAVELLKKLVEVDNE